MDISPLWMPIDQFGDSRHEVIARHICSVPRYAGPNYEHLGMPSLGRRARPTIRKC